MGYVLSVTTFSPPLNNSTSLLDPSGLSLSGERVTLSTVGVIPGILRLAEEGRLVHLAVSLHSADQAEREALVPVAAEGAAR